MSKHKEKEKGKSSGGEEANLATFDEDVLAYLAESFEVPHSIQHGKGYSSNNMGDGPAKKSAVPVGGAPVYTPAPLATLSVSVRRSLIEKMSQAIREFLEERISPRQSYFLLTTLAKWGWENPETALRALKAHYNSLTSVEDRAIVPTWMEALHVTHCRPSKVLENIFLDRHIRYVAFDVVRRGYLAMVHEDWTSDRSLQAMVNQLIPDAPLLDQYSSHATAIEVAQPVFR